MIEWGTVGFLVALILLLVEWLLIRHEKASWESRRRGAVAQLNVAWNALGGNYVHLPGTKEAEGRAMTSLGQAIDILGGTITGPPVPEPPELPDPPGKDPDSPEELAVAEAAARVP